MNNQTDPGEPMQTDEASDITQDTGERYRGKCDDGDRCLQGCLATESCYWARRGVKVYEALPISQTEAEENEARIDAQF